MKDYVELGISRGLIKFNEDKSRITYVNQGKERNYSNPEERVQAETFLRLVIDYKYPPAQIKQFVPVTMGSEVKEADIVVYSDRKCLTPYILVECKKQEVTELEYKQAIEQAYSYSYALAGEIKYVWVTSGIKSDYLEVNKNQNTRVQIPDIPQFGVKKIASYKYVYDADKLPEEEGKQRFFDLSKIEQSELTRRFKQAHEALWEGGKMNPSEAFDELDKLIFCKIWDERKDRKAGTPYDFQIITVSPDEEPNAEKRRQKENENLRNRINELYEEGRKKDPEVFKDSISLNAEKIRTVVGYLESVSLSETDLDSKGRAFETFMGSYFRGEYGQYFTPREVVSFIVDVLPIKNTSKVIDSTCGSGGFLLYSLNKVREAATDMYPDYKTDVNQYQRWHNYWHDFASNNLFGIEISGQISRAAKMNMILHDDGHTNVITEDGLFSDEELFEKTGNKGFGYGTFDFVITNPPFGSKIKQTEKAYLKEYNFGKKPEDWLALDSKPKPLRDSQSTEVLFIEQNYKFLKEGGFLSIVLPDGVLTNSSMQFVRTQIEDWFRIIAVISLPQFAFRANKAGVKSSILFLQKWSKKETEQILERKKKIQDALLAETNYKETIKLWRKDLTKRENEFADRIKVQQNISRTKAKQTEEYKAWDSKEKEKLKFKIEMLQNQLEDKYLQRKQEILDDYPIFMAIAEEIGYDSTGRKVPVNELYSIAEELKKFMKTI